MKFYFIFIALLLSACVTNSTPERIRLSKAQQDYDGFVNAMSNLPSSSDPSACSSKWFKVAELSVKTLEGRMMVSHMIINSNDYSNTQKRSNREALETLTPLAANSRLDLADKAAALGCKSKAKEYYNEILKTYTGLNYESYRDRAKVGLADIR